MWAQYNNKYTVSKLSVIIDEESRNLLFDHRYERTFYYRKQGNENCTLRGLRRIRLENILPGASSRRLLTWPSRWTIVQNTEAGMKFLTQRH